MAEAGPSEKNPFREMFIPDVLANRVLATCLAEAA